MIANMHHVERLEIGMTVLIIHNEHASTSAIVFVEKAVSTSMVLAKIIVGTGIWESWRGLSAAYAIDRSAGSLNAQFYEIEIQ